MADADFEQVMGWLTKLDVEWWQEQVDMLTDSQERALKQITSLHAEIDWYRSVAEVAGRMLRDVKVQPKTDDEASILAWVNRIGGPRPGQRRPVVVQQTMLDALAHNDGVEGL